MEKHVTSCIGETTWHIFAVSVVWWIVWLLLKNSYVIFSNIRGSSISRTWICPSKTMKSYLETWKASKYQLIRVTCNSDCRPKFKRALTVSPGFTGFCISYSLLSSMPYTNWRYLHRLSVKIDLFEPHSPDFIFGWRVILSVLLPSHCSWRVPVLARIYASCAKNNRCVYFAWLSEWPMTFRDSCMQWAFHII